MVEKGGKIPEENYMTARRIADNPTLRSSIVDRAHADLLAWIARYENYAEFFEIFSPVLEAYKHVETKFKKVACFGKLLCNL